MNIKPFLKIFTLTTLVTITLFGVISNISVEAYDSKKESSFQEVTGEIQKANTAQAVLIKLNLPSSSKLNKENTIKTIAKNLDFKIDFILANLNSFVATLNETQLNLIRKLPEVRQATPYKTYSAPSVPQNTDLGTTIMAETSPESLPRYFQAIGLTNSESRLGYTGKNQTVAVIDTGIDFTLPELQGKSVNEGCFSDVNKEPGIKSYSICPNGKNTQTGIGSAKPCTGLPGCNHGSHVAGIVAGSKTARNHSGIAPDAKIVGINVFHIVENTDKCTPTNSGKFKDGPAVKISKCIFTSNFAYLKAIDFVLDQNQQTPIAAVNMSLGTNETKKDNCDDIDTPNFHEVLNQNISLVIATGNAYNKKQMAHPACQSRVISVGGYDEVFKTDAFFSNLSPNTTLFAPGIQIKSTGLSMTGTSMSTPMVSGTIALLKQAGLSSVNEIRTNLINNGTDVKTKGGTPTNGKLININKSLSSIGNNKVGGGNVTPTPKPTPLPTPIITPIPTPIKTNPNPTPIVDNTNCKSGQLGWCANFYNNTSLKGNPSDTIRLAELNTRVNLGSPSAKINNDLFSARFTSKFNITKTGYHTFKYNFDDGVRVTLKKDGYSDLIISDWRNKAPKDLELSELLSTGQYEIVIEYYENKGGSTYVFDLYDNSKNKIQFYNI
jgi:subtilisin family serine protease